MRIRTIIVDDEAPARSEMRYLLEKSEDIEILGEASTAAEALKMMNEICYDLAFLDIDMPGMDGLEMVEEVRKLDCQPSVIFTTAYGQFAVKAFEVGVVDYLVKPVADDRLEDALDRVRQRLGGKSAATKPKPAVDDNDYLDRIPVTKQSKTILLCPAEIFFIESHGEYTVINSEKGKFISSLRLKDFEVRLSPKSFFRSHRSFVVNLDHVTEMTSLYGGLYMLKMEDTETSEVPVSRRQTKHLKTLLGMK